jgi:hypothetical protein
MKTPNRDILVLLNNEFMTDRAIELEIRGLNELLRETETASSFCAAHELVDRNRITSKKEKLIKASQHEELKPFRFLINKN